MIEIRIHPQSFDIDYEMKRIQVSSSSGAMVSFLGSVRDIQSKNSLKNLEIEHYPKMAHKVLNETAKYAFEKWKLSRCLIIHRYGKLKINDPIVLIERKYIKRFLLGKSKTLTGFSPYSPVQLLTSFT